MSISDYNHTVAVQWSECVRGKGPLSSSHTPRYVDVSSLLLLLPKLKEQDKNRGNEKCSELPIKSWTA